jgi:Ca-activated chloride channel family protein
MLSKWFETPEFLVFLSAIPIVNALMLFAWRRRRRAAEALGSPITLRRQTLVGAGLRRLKGLFLLLALMLAGIACAGPQWGIDESAHMRKGRDIFVVLDLSRSMLAEQPRRRTLAVRSLHKLANTLETHGGNRVALIGFAAKARVFFPLTQDCDHLRHTLAQIEADDYPTLGAVDPVSGTRIGAALKLAVAQCDPKRAHRPVIVLLSDGDDPADDGEWLEGVEAAKAKQLVVHVVGFGDPKQDETIPIGRDTLMFGGKPIKTKLNESLLREIAQRTGGDYQPAHTSAIALGDVVQRWLDADDLREEAPSGGTIPKLQLRYVWFLLPAALLLMLTLVMNEGPTPRREPPISDKKPRVSWSRSKTLAAAHAVLALFSVAAADPQQIEAWIREGNRAYSAGDYDGALKAYELAESSTLDPGLIAFNKAAAYYRLGRHKEAIDSYRRALEDDVAPPERRARAHFDLGNALLQNAGGSSHQLGEAVASYRACLHQKDIPDKLRADARANLELAQLLWLQARKNEPEPKTPAKPPPKDPLDDRKGEKDHYEPVTVDKKKEQKKDADGVAGDHKTDKLRGQTIDVLPDADAVQSFAQDDALRTLEAHAKRIAAERRRLYNSSIDKTLSAKDW